jgi:DNA-binding winged helix-turn-helix (wHTH) protein/TolB-like protein
MSNAICHLYEFGPFRLDPHERLLLRAGHPIPLTPKAFDLLTVLVQRGGHLIEKQELLEAVWPASFVEEGNLCVMVHALRKAFGSDHRDYTYIETVPKRGYRFAAEVKLVEYAPAGPLALKEPAELELPPVRLISSRVSSTASDREHFTAWRASKGGGWRQLGWNNRRLLLVLALAPIFAIAMFLAMKNFSRNQTPAASQTALAHSLAILPFAAIGDKGDDIYLGLGISDAITTKLGNTRKVVTRPTSAMARYVGAARDLEAAGREQKVDAVLDGRIQHVGDRIRLTVQLIRVSDGVQMWGDTFDEKYTNIFAVEDVVSEQLARSIRLELTGAEQNRLTERPTENSDAYQDYVKGRYFWNKRTAEGLRKGLEFFQAAVSLDPNYTQAYVGIADSYALLGLINALAPKEAFPKAKEAAAKALETDPELAEAHATLGFVDFYFDWDGLAAENEFRHALRSNPDSAMAHAWYAQDLAAMGRFNEARAEGKRAQDADPVSLTVGTNRRSNWKP